MFRPNIGDNTTRTVHHLGIHGGLNYPANFVELSANREATSCTVTPSFPSISWNPRFITEFTTALYLYLPWTRPIKSTPPYSISTRSTLLLSTHLRLGHACGLFPSSFLTNNLYAVLFSSIRATCPAHLILLNFMILIILFMQFSSLSYNFNLLGPNTLLRTPFILSLCSSLNLTHKHTEPQA
jgi:hypothetical protein